MKLLYFLSSSGCLFWRCRQPAEWMKRYGLAEIRTIEGEYATDTEISDGLAWCDAIITQSPYSIDSLVSLMKYKSMGKMIWVDFDDFPFECSYLNSHYRTLGVQEVTITDPTTGQNVKLWQDGVNGFDIAANYKKQRALLNILQACDLLTVTTDHLRQKFIEMGADPERTFVVQNAVDFKRWRPNYEARETYPDAYRIGWICSASHAEDWFSVYMTLREYMDKHQGTKLVVMGDVGIDISAKFGPNELEWIGWSDLNSGHYAYQAANLGLDVAICPLADNEFNKCKSSLKYAEMTAFGYPVIAQDMLPYSPVITHGQDGLLAGGRMSWMTALELMRKPSFRSTLHVNALIKCHKEFDLDVVCHKWADVYSRAKIMGPSEREVVI